MTSLSPRERYKNTSLERVLTLGHSREGFWLFHSPAVATLTLFFCPSAIQDPDDLPFHKGEILTVVSKDEEQWWTARNALGQTGSIPVPYICKVSKDKDADNFFS